MLLAASSCTDMPGPCYGPTDPTGRARGSAAHLTVEACVVDIRIKLEPAAPREPSPAAAAAGTPACSGRRSRLPGPVASRRARRHAKT